MSPRPPSQIKSVKRGAFQAGSAAWTWVTQRQRSRRALVAANEAVAHRARAGRPLHLYCSALLHRERRVKPLLPMTAGGSELGRALAELSLCGRNAALRSVQSGRARTASYAHGRSASVACGLGQLKVALRPRSPSSQSGASRIEWKFDFSCREWMDCLVECEQLGSAGSLWCNMFSGRQQTRARERVFQRTLQSVPGHSHSHYIPPQSLRLLGDD